MPASTRTCLCGRARVRRLPTFALLCLTAVLGGCSRNASVVENRKTSAIQVSHSGGAPLVIRTPSAEFRFSSNGYLQGGLLRGGEALALDDPGAGTDGSSLNLGGRKFLTSLLIWSTPRLARLRDG